jgi:hypothetical protein
MTYKPEISQPGKFLFLTSDLILSHSKSDTASSKTNSVGELSLRALAWTQSVK